MPDNENEHLNDEAPQNQPGPIQVQVDQEPDLQPAPNQAPAPNSSPSISVQVPPTSDEKLDQMLKNKNHQNQNNIKKNLGDQKKKFFNEEVNRINQKLGQEKGAALSHMEGASSQTALILSILDMTYHKCKYKLEMRKLNQEYGRQDEINLNKIPSSFTLEMGEKGILKDASVYHAKGMLQEIETKGKQKSNIQQEAEKTFSTVFEEWIKSQNWKLEVNDRQKICITKSDGQPVSVEEFNDAKSDPVTGFTKKFNDSMKMTFLEQEVKLPEVKSEASAEAPSPRRP